MIQLYSLSIERHVISGLIKFPQLFPDFDSLLSENDFYSKTHKTIFVLTKNLLLQNIKLDRVILAEKLRELGITSNEEVDIIDYINAFFSSQIKKESVKDVITQLVSLRIRRDLVSTSDNLKKHINETIDKPISEVLDACDKIYNSKVNSFNVKSSGPIDIFSTLEDTIEFIGNNPPDPNQFMFGPFPRINEQFGSLLRPGNITIIGARTGVAKTSLGMYYLTYVAEKYNIPVLHLDMGEMSAIELQMRSICMLSGGRVPYNLVESGEWRNNKDIERIVREIWPRVKKIKCFYEQVGNKSGREICNTIRRFAYNTAGRGNPFLIHYDYIKPLPSDNFNAKEWQIVGQFIQDTKCLIQDLGVSFWASLQLNRSGITTNKTADEVDDSENSFGISDRIVQQASHAFLIRKKLLDEIATEGNQFGNLKVLPMKMRHLGRDFKRVLTPVKVQAGKFVNNYYNINSTSFFFEEKGDLHDIIQTMNGQTVLNPPPSKDGDKDGGKLI